MTVPTPRLEALLAGPSRWREFEHLDRTGSTNDVVTERLAAGAGPGLVVVADRQTSGRGRLGRRWEDLPDRPGASLLVSVAVRTPSRLTFTPLATGLAARHALRQVGARAQLKWPNDLLLAVDEAAELRKCGGILVENPGDGALVIGVGLDLDWRGVGRDGDAATWTSVAEVTGRDVDRWEVLADLLASLDQWLHDIERDPNTLLGVYQQACTSIGRRVVVDTGATRLEGRVTQLAPDGALVVDTGTQQLAITNGDVTHLS